MCLGQPPRRTWQLPEEVWHRKYKESAWSALLT